MKNAKLITIFTETALETQLVKHIEQLGVTGYTITNARGKGNSGVRNASWEANSNIRIEIICCDMVAKEVTNQLQEKYYGNFAMVIYRSDIEVLRPEKFKK